MEIQSGQTLSSKLDILANSAGSRPGATKTEQFALLLADTLEKAGLDGEEVTIQVRNGEVSVRFAEDSSPAVPASGGNPFSNPALGLPGARTAAQTQSDLFAWAS